MSDDASADDFFSEGRSGRGKFLKDWKKRPTKKINTWLHTKFIPRAVHRHSFPRVVVREKDGVSTKEIWGWNYNCHESKKVLEKQHERDDDDTRKYPPCVDPFCMMVEYVRAQVNETRSIVAAARKKNPSIEPEQLAELTKGRLTLTTPLFEFEDSTKIETIYAGGFAGLFDDRKLSEEEAKDVRRARINIKEAWKQTGIAKAAWLFQIVDDDDPAAGIQKTWQTELVGEKTKTVIHDKRASLGKEGGDPWKNPYCIQWEHLSEEKGFGKQYHARPIDSVKYRPEISALIRDEDPLDVTLDLALYSPKELRAQMESACKFPGFPFEKFFKGAAEPAKPTPETDDKPARAPKPVVPATPPPTTAPAAPAPADDEVACDGGGEGGCGKNMKLSDPKCPHCGFVYEVEPAAPPAPPPPPPAPPKAKSRSEVMAERAAAAAAAPKPEAAAPPAPAPAPPVATSGKTQDELDAEDDMDIPF